MAGAEQTRISNLVDVELCSHIMCSCKPRFHGSAMTATIIPSVNVENESIHTKLYIISNNGEIDEEISGVRNPHEIQREFDDCDGPVVLSSGKIVCGAIDRLRRKEVYGRKEV